MKKKVWFIGLLLCCLCFFGKDVYAQVSFDKSISIIAKHEHKSLYSKKQWLENGQMDYVITPKDIKWDKMTYTEQLEASNPPMDLIKSISDEELIELAIEYPFLCDIFAFNDFESAMRHFSYTSTIFYELGKRDVGNISTIIIDKLDKHTVDYSELVSDVSKEQADNYMKELFMEAFLAKKDVVNSLSQKSMQKLVNVIDNKYKQKEGICDDFATSLYFYSTLQHELGEIPDKLLSEELYKKVIEGNNNDTALSGFVSKNQVRQIFTGAWYIYGNYKKYGVSAPCYQYYIGDYTDKEKRAINESYDNHNWTRLGGATKQYNCHSYCWISTLTRNIYWLGSPKKFTSGNNIIDNGVNKKIQKGQYIVIHDGYGNIVHSLRAITSSKGASVSSYLDSTLTNSKLGVAGLYKAPLGDIFTLYSGFYYHTYTNNN